MDIKKQRAAFKSQVTIALDRILFIQNGVADLYAEVFLKYKNSNANDQVIKNHLAEAKVHLANIDKTHAVIKKLLTHSFDGEK